MANSAVVGLLRALLVADTAEFDKAMKRSGDAAKAWSKDLKAIGRDATAVGKTLTAGITLPLAALGGAASKLAIDFESSFAGVRKTVDASEAEFGKLEKQFRDLAKTIPVNVNEINKLGEAAGALGIPKQAIAAFVETMAGLGTATNLTADEAANAIARIQNIFGAAGKDTDRFASTLVGLGNAGASTEKEIVDMAQRIAGAGKTVGLTQAQILGISSTLASVGINAEAGGSAMSKLFLKINQAVGAGGADLAKFAKAAGLSAADFKKAFETDAAGAVNTLIQKIGEMGNKAGPTITGLVGKNIILTDTILRVAGAGTLLTDQLALANTEWEKNTALSNETAKRYATTESQLKLLWQRLQDVGITLGQALLPSIKKFSDALAGLIPWVESLVKSFTDLPTGIQALIIGFAAVAAAAGPLLILFGSMSSGLGTVIGMFSKGGLAAEAFGAVLAFLAANPVVAIIAGLAILGTAIYAVATSDTELQKEMKAGSTAFRTRTDELEKTIATFDRLSKSHDLTKDQAAELDKATGDLATASGLSREAFDREMKASDELTISFHKQLEERKKLQEFEIAEAKKKVAQAEAALAANKAMQGQVLGGTAISRGLAGGVGAPGGGATQLMGGEERSKAIRELDAGAKTLTDNLFKARQELAALPGQAAAAAGGTMTLAQATAFLYGERVKHTGSIDTETAATEKLTKAQREAQAHAEKIAELAARMSGVDTTEKVKDLTEAVELNRKSMGDAALSTEALIDAVKRLHDDGAALSPVLLHVWSVQASWAEAEKAMREARIRGLEALTEAERAYSRTVEIEAEARIAVLANEKAIMDQRLGTVNDAIARGKAQGAAGLLALTPNLAAQVDPSYNPLGIPPPKPQTLGEKLEWTKPGGKPATNFFDTVKIGNAPSAFSGMGKALGSNLVNEIPASMIKAFQGGGNVGKSVGATIGSSVGSTVGPAVGKAATKAISGVVGKGLGAAIGGLAGNALPIVGPIIGNLVGGLVDKAFSHKGRDAAVGFAESMGGFDELHKKLGTLGAEGEKMWVQLTGVGKKDEKGAQKIIDNIGKAFEEADKKAAEFAAKMQKVGEEIGKLGNALQVFGGVVPKSMRPLIDELLKSKDLTADMRKALEGFAKDPSWQTLEGKAKDLGIDLKGLGKQFQQSKLGEIGIGFARDLQMFADSGADMQIVIEGMSDELSDLYSTAQATGVKLPATLKPYMQTLVDQGLLLDENGKKVEHLNEDTFADIEDKGLTDVTNVLKEIRDLLKDNLPRAADEGARGVQAAFDRHKVTIPVEWEYPGAPGGPPAPAPPRGGGEDPGTNPPPRGPTPQPGPSIGLEGGTHGRYVDWGSGTAVVLHGKERVTPEGEIGGGGRPIQITVVSTLDGREVARNQIKYIPREFVLAGV